MWIFSTLLVKTRNIFFYSIDVLHIILRDFQGLYLPYVPLGQQGLGGRFRAFIWFIFHYMCTCFSFFVRKFQRLFLLPVSPFLWENFRGCICYLSLPLLPHPILHVSKIIPSVVFGVSPGGVPLFRLSLSVTISVWQEVVGGIWWGSLKGEIFICTKILHQV